MRGCDCQLTHKLDLGNQRLLPSSPIVGMYILSTVLMVGAVFKDAVLREQCVAESIWKEYVTDLVN